MVKLSISQEIRLKESYIDPPPVIEGDENQLHQVIINLLTNAFEAIEGSGTIEISTFEKDLANAESMEMFYKSDNLKGKCVGVSIRDNGKGITSEIDSIFDPFYSTKTDQRGLGLSVTLGIVRGHKGGIIVNNTEDGAEFSILFPLVESHKDDHDPIVEDTSELKFGNILICDDEELILDTTMVLLQKQGHDVTSFNSGYDLIEHYRINKESVDLIILDLTMPKMDGITCLHQLKDINPDAKIILSSGYHDLAIKQKYGDLGFDDFLKKPYGVLELGNMIQRVLHK